MKGIRISLMSLSTICFLLLTSCMSVNSKSNEILDPSNREMVDLLHSKNNTYILSQSSMWADIFGPKNAVDSNLKTYIHTAKGDKNPYWSVTFKKLCYIESISIIHSDNGPYRFRDLYIQIYDAKNEIIYTSELLNPENIENGPEKLFVDLSGKNINGKKVVIKRQPDPDYSGQGGVPGGDPEGSYLLLISEVNIQGYKI